MGQDIASLGHQRRDSYDAPCFADKDSYDNDSIVEKIASKRTRVEESPADKGDVEDSELMVTHAATRCKVQLFQHYLVEQGFSDNAHASHDACAELIYSRAHASFKQTTLDSFFSFVGLPSLLAVITSLCHTGSSPIWISRFIGPKFQEPKWPNKVKSTLLEIYIVYRKYTEGMYIVYWRYARSILEVCM